MARKRIAITGMGIVSCLGSNVNSFWNSLKEAKSGIKELNWAKEGNYKTQIAGPVKGFNPSDFFDRKETRLFDDYAAYAIAATKMAVDDSGIDFNKIDPYKAAVIIGSGSGGVKTFDNSTVKLEQCGAGSTRPFAIPKFLSNMASGYIAQKLGLHGPSYATVTACSSAGHAIANAGGFIISGDAVVAIAGGSDAAVARIAIDGFGGKMGALSTRNNDPEGASRPFTLDRDGFVLSEGAGIVILEDMEFAKNRGAHIYAELAGWGMTSDGYSPTAPLPGGEAAAYAMNSAMNKAKLNPKDIGYICAHGTSTPLGDAAETNAIKLAFGNYAKEVNVGEEGIISPIKNYDNPDPELDLKFVSNAIETKGLEACLSNSLGFWGQNCVLALKKI
jgi:3-oxoacyl-[acyl-carrier-protein] synthase II